MGITKAKQLKSRWGLSLFISMIGIGIIYGFMHLIYLLPFILSLMIHTQIGNMIGMSEGTIPMIQLDDTLLPKDGKTVAKTKIKIR